MANLKCEVKRVTESNQTLEKKFMLLNEKMNDLSILLEQNQVTYKQQLTK